MIKAVLLSQDIWPSHFFARVDDSADTLFYESPRKVVHIDNAAIAAVAQCYAEVLPKGGLLLDLMSSWRSHLPDGLAPRAVVGLGLNAEEMADNPQLTTSVVHDLNLNPALPFADHAFDGAMRRVSVQYIVDPIAVFREVNRILRVGAPFIVTFSDRCFPMKAVSVWTVTTDGDHLRIVSAYFERSGGWEGIKTEDRSPAPAGSSDPLYAVWARKAGAV